MNNFIKIITGSHLYGLANENSDVDYKIVRIPSKEDCYLNRIGRIKQSTSDEEDYEIIPIQEFIKQACSAQTNVMDMIHAPKDKIVYCNNWDLWNKIVDNRAKLYTKHMKGILGFCISQSQKYSFRIEKYNEIKQLRGWMLRYLNYDRTLRLFELFDNIRDEDKTYIKKGIEEGSKNEDGRCLFVDKRCIQIHTPLTKVIDTLDSILKSFGSRVKNADQKDWKSISHAFRIGYQLQYIYKDGGYSYPLPETEFLRDVNEGRLDYDNDGLGEKLQNLIDECVTLSDNSEYPDQVDREFWDNIILEFYK